MRIIAVANQKGGVGKTTTSVNLSASLGLSGCKVLLVDFDPQGNATMGSGVDKASLEVSIYDWLIDGVAMEGILHKCSGRYELVPSNADLTAVEVELLSQDQRELRLRQKFTEANLDYDFVIIDCPPSLNILTL
ncbi:MAG: AAA family ATPase, partial [Gammaproteobacteria bacterium]|nr:AAA family ATPase [Gammaproteobacteria bacterium]